MELCVHAALPFGNDSFTNVNAGNEEEAPMPPLRSKEPHREASDSDSVHRSERIQTETVWQYYILTVRGTIAIVGAVKVNARIAHCSPPRIAAFAAVQCSM